VNFSKGIKRLRSEIFERKQEQAKAKADLKSDICWKERKKNEWEL